MKKLLSLGMAVVLASAASAVTMNWSSASAIKFDGSNLKSDATVTGYLIALDAFATSYDVTESFSFTDVGTKVDEKNKTSAMSKISKDWEIDTDNYGNGDTFAVLLKYTGATDGKTYWNLSSGLVTLTGMALDPPADADNTSSTFSFGTAATEGKLTAGGGWTAAAAVPEPGTAALALLGIGMLIRRRRA